MIQEKPELTAEMTVAAQKALIALVEGRCPTCGESGTKEQVGRCISMRPCGHRYQGTLQPPTMPDGYQLVNAVSALGYNVHTIQGVHVASLKAKSGRAKLFQTPERATRYARRHAELKLTADQQVPGWK
jgi:predicted RNA-binding Zn-ribbon protein involved in translation (DUF1610 family)